MRFTNNILYSYRLFFYTDTADIKCNPPQKKNLSNVWPIVRTHQYIIQDFSYIPRLYPTTSETVWTRPFIPFFFSFQNVVCGHILFCCCNPLGFLYRSIFIQWNPSSTAERQIGEIVCNLIASSQKSRFEWSPSHLTHKVFRWYV